MTANTLAARTLADPVAFLPGVRGHDALAQQWLSQVTLRLRREVCWLWRERGLQGAPNPAGAALPPPVDRALAALDLVRYECDKRAFFADDVTARHLSDRIAAARPAISTGDEQRGSFGWVTRQLHLQPVECFVLAVALLPSVDSAAGQVIASCLNEPTRTWPTLALAQRLWDEPNELLHCFDPAHTLLRHGLFAAASGAGPNDWQAPLCVPPLVASELLFAGGALPAALEPITTAALPAGLDAAAIARVSAAVSDDAEPRRRQGMRIVPVIGAAGAPLA